MPTEFTTTVGRIVWGNPAKASKKVNQETNQPVLRDGQEVEQWVFGVAFPKAEFEQNIMPHLNQEALSAYPNGVPQNFSWKIKDGDTATDAKGNAYSEKEGRAGCYILTISTEAFQPPIFKWEGNAYRQLEGHEIKTGDYITARISAKVNVPTKTTHTPGLYINPVALNFVGYGQEIVGSSIDPSQVFGEQPVALPPGASATPLAPETNVAMPTAAPQPVAPAAPVAQPAPAAAPVAPQPAPAHNFVNNAITPGAPAAAPAAPQPFATMPGVPAGR